MISTLSIIKENNQEKNRKIKIKEGLYSIGRQLDVDIKLADSLVSRKHAAIQVKDGKAIIRDLNSRNKTYINGRPVEKLILNDGDEIRIGNSLIIYREVNEIFEEENEDNPVAISRIFEIEKNPLFEKEADEYSQTELKLANQKLIALYKIGNIINTYLEPKVLLTKILSGIFDIINVDRGSILLWDEEKEDFELAISQSRDDTTPDTKMQFSRTIIDQVFSKKEAILTLDAKEDERFQTGQSIILQNIRSAMCVPMSVQDKILGVIYLDTKQQHRENFGEKDLELLSAIGMQAGIALENARLYSELKEVFVSAIASLASAIEAKDPYTKGHSERVSYLSEKLANKIGLESDECNNTKLAGLLHDIGKIGIPESILNKPSKINDAEIAVIQTHPLISHQIIAKMKGLKNIAEIAKHHHEKVDGSGYPEHLSNSEIPLISKIIAIADTYDALTSDRVYRDKLKPEQALEYIQKNVDTAFEKELVEAFFDLIKNEKLEIPKEDSEDSDAFKLIH